MSHQADVVLRCGTQPVASRQSALRRLDQRSSVGLEAPGQEGADIGAADVANRVTTRLRTGRSHDKPEELVEGLPSALVAHAVRQHNDVRAHVTPGLGWLKMPLDLLRPSATSRPAHERERLSLDAPRNI